MEIFIVPYYLYTHYDVYEIIINELETRCVSAKYFNISGDVNLDKINKKYLNLIEKDKIIDVKTLKLSNKTDVLSRILNFLKYLFNFYHIKRQLLKKKPGLVIIGSDSGGVYIRRVQEICQKNKIPIIIIQSVLFLPVNERQELTVYYPKIVHMLLKILNLHRTFTYIGDIPGAYLEDSYVFVHGQTSKEIIQSLDKNPNRIIVTGNPVFDLLQNSKSLNSKDELEYIKSLGLPPNSKYIIYFTEMIHELYGDKYLEDLNLELRYIFDRLFENFYVIIKFHPRENVQNRLNIRNQFNSAKYRFLDDADDKLIISSELCIAHHSAILNNAILLKKPILSINLTGHKSIMKFPGEVIVRKIEDIENKLNKILKEPSYNATICNLLYDWVKDNYANFNEGISTKKTVDSIMKIIRCSNG